MSNGSASDASAALPCEQCGYDLRGQPADGRCPECAFPVAESRELARVPRRPAWRDSDPRWRRRVFAGACGLALVPAWPLAARLGWLARLPGPRFSKFQLGQTLDESMATWTSPFLMLCVGATLLFARERGRRRGRLDWTRRWGVGVGYLTLLIGAIPIVFLISLVGVGIGALNLSIPLRYQPAATDGIVRASVFLLRHAPHPSRASELALPACSAYLVLLACTPLFDALRSVGRIAFACFLVVPLALAAMGQLAGVALYAVDQVGWASGHLPIEDFFFGTGVLADGLATFGPTASPGKFFVELIKWLACVGIAVRLGIAQLAAMRARRVVGTAIPLGS